MWNQGLIDIAPGIAHTKAYGLGSGVVFDGCHLVHCDQDAIVGAGEAGKRRMASAPDGIGRTGNAKDADGELNFGNGGWLENTVWSQPCGGRPEDGPNSVSTRSMGD